MPAFIRLACVLCALPCLTACAPMLSFIGTNQTLVQIIAQVERVKLAGDGASYVTSSKTLTDHALSKVTGADCKLFNIVSSGTVCATNTANATADAKAKQAMNESAQQTTVQATAETSADNSAQMHEQAAGDD